MILENFCHLFAPSISADSNKSSGTCAIAAVKIPTIEVHMTNIHAREEFRHTSLLSGVCKAIVAGFGEESYILALEGLIKTL